MFYKSTSSYSFFLVLTSSIQSKLLRLTQILTQIDTKIFWLTRHQLSEFLTVLNTGFAYLYLYRNCAKRHKEIPIKTSLINCCQFKVSVSFLLYWSIHLIQRHRSKCTDTPSKLPHISLSPLYSSIDSNFWTQRKHCLRAQRRRFIFQLHMLFPEALNQAQEQLWVCEQTDAEYDHLRSSASRTIILAAVFCSIQHENWSDNKQHKALTMDARVTFQLCTSLNKVGIQNIHEHFHFSSADPVASSKSIWRHFFVLPSGSGLAPPAAPPAQLAVARSVGPKEED